MDPFLEESQKPSTGFDLKALWRSFARRKWLFIVPFILCLSMAGVTIKVMTPIFHAKGQVQVRMDRMRSNLLTEQQNAYSRRDPDGEVRSEMLVLLTSPSFVSKVVQLNGLDKAIQAAAEANGRPVPTDETAARIADGRLRRMIRVDRDGLHLFNIGVVDPDPDRAYQLTKDILELFLDEFRASKVAARSSTRDFLESQREIYELELDASETELNTFLASIASETLLENLVNATNINETQEKLNLLRERYYGQDTTELANLEAAATSVLGRLPRTDSYSQDAVTTRIVRELEDLGATLLTLPVDGNEHSRQVNVLGQLRVRLNSRIENLVATNYSQLGLMDRNRLSQYVYFRMFRGTEKKVMDRLNRHVREFRDFSARQPVQSSRLQELQGEVERARSLVQTIDTEITQHTLNLEAGMANVGFQLEIRREVFRPRVPIHPDKIKLAFMAVVLSFCLGLGLVVAAIFLDRSFSSVDEMERVLGVTVIGTLPLIQDDHFERKRKLKILRWVTIILGILAIAAVGFLIIYPRMA